MSHDDCKDFRTNTWSPTKKVYFSKQRSELLLTDEINLLLSSGCCVELASMQGNPQTGSWKLLLAESGMLGFGIQNSNPESHERLEMESKFHRQGIQNPVSGIRRHSSDSRIQAIKDCLGLALWRNVDPTYNKVKCQLFFLSLFSSFYSFLFIYQLLLLTGVA